MRRATIWLAALLLAGCAAQPPSVADLPRDACDGPFGASVIPAEMVDGLLVIPAAVNGQPVKLRLDTGANDLLLLWENAARALAIRSRPTGSGQMAVGDVPLRRGFVGELSIGALSWRDLEAAILPARTGTGADGHLGVDLLEAGDLIHRLPMSPLLMIIEARGCQENIASGLMEEGTRIARVPVARVMEGNIRGHMIATLTVNGKALRALVDTGSTVTAVTEAGLARIGGSAPEVGSVRVRTIDGTVHRHGVRRFDSVAFGPLRRDDPALLVVPDSRLTRDLAVEAYVGADILFAQPAMISAEAGTIYVFMDDTGF